MDQLEDLKECPGEDGIDDVVEKLTNLYQLAQETLDTMGEAFQAAQPQPVPIKKDDVEKEDASTAGGQIKDHPKHPP